MIRHKGTLIAFAMDSERRIHFSILDLSGNAGAQAPQNADASNAKSTRDSDAWTAPRELIFPGEIAEVGFGIADQTSMRVFKKGSEKAEAYGAQLPPEKSDEANGFDYFRSTTARLGADAPFQALSDGQYVYLFRQAISADATDAGNRKLDAKGGEVKGADNAPVPLVNSTLLADRFTLAGDQLEPVMEVRYQRSRSRVRPQSRKDSLGAKDLDGNFFYEPTRELKFVGNLSSGRFAVLLLPTSVAEIRRWQIFAENAHTGAMESFNVERSTDGLFNTRGSQTYTCVDHPEVFLRKEGRCVEAAKADPGLLCDKDLIPRIVTEGFAESAIGFAAADDRVTLDQPLKLGAKFTIEAWINPAKSAGTRPLILLGGDGGVSVAIEANTRLRAGFGPDIQIRSESLISPGKWNHIAVTFDGKSCRVFVNGRPGGEAKDLGGKLPAEASIKTFGAVADAFNGIIDEIRIWNRARSPRELRADLHHRLTGMEPELRGYWRFDEGAGSAVHDQTDNRADGAIAGDAERAKKIWTTSDAPLGEHPGINRSSFRFAGRTLQSGPAAILYFQQAEAASGYDGKKKPLKQNGRVMLAVATNDGEAANAGKNQIAALDFGVSASGRLAQTPDLPRLAPLPVASASNQSLNALLDEISGLQSRFRLLDEEVNRLNPVIATLDDALATPPLINAGITDSALAGLNKQLSDFQRAINELPRLQIEKERLDREATVTAFEHVDYRGRELPLLPPTITNDFLKAKNFDGIISSLKVPGVTSVVLFDAGGDRSGAFTVDIDDLRGWSDRAVSLDIRESADHAEQRAKAAGDLATAQASVTAARNKVLSSRAALAVERDEKARQLNAAKAALDANQSLVGSGASAMMPLIHTDPFGLSISGGLLGFAWTNDAPLLFDSATGSLALYFRGAGDQFFTAYYDTKTERARYELNVKDGPACVTCLARSTEAEMDKLKIEVSGEEDEDRCTVAISLETAGATLTETWTKVPRNSHDFAKTLNGMADQRVYIGSGQIVRESAGDKLSMPEGPPSAGWFRGGASAKAAASGLSIPRARTTPPSTARNG